MSIKAFFINESENILSDLENIVASAQAAMLVQPEEYTEPGCDGPSVDIRLCVDWDVHHEKFYWILRTGDSSFDPRHSDYCAAGSITLDTAPKELLEELVEDLKDQMYELPPGTGA